MVLPADDRKIGPRVVLDLKNTAIDPKVAASIPSAMRFERHTSRQI
jgi:hypothetical protein